MFIYHVRSSFLFQTYWKCNSLIKIHYLDLLLFFSKNKKRHKIKTPPKMTFSENKRMAIIWIFDKYKLWFSELCFNQTCFQKQHIKHSFLAKYDNSYFSLMPLCPSFHIFFLIVLIFIKSLHTEVTPSHTALNPLFCFS